MNVDHLRHGFGRKLSAFEHAARTVKITAAEEAELPEIEVAADQDPFDVYVPDHIRDGCVFIAITVDGSRYLVNCEGFDYCRYVARLEVVA